MASFTGEYQLPTTELTLLLKRGLARGLSYVIASRVTCCGLHLRVVDLCWCEQHLRQDYHNTHVMVQVQEPSAKRRKVDGGAGEDSYPSDFQDLLEAENDQGGRLTHVLRPLTEDSIETDDAWPRPPLPKVNPATDTLGEYTAS